MLRSLPLAISDDLRITIGGRRGVTLTPSQGLTLAEDLTRKAFRRAMTEEAIKAGIVLDDPNTLCTEAG